MYSVYFVEKEGKRKGSTSMQIDRVIEFEPHGADVRLTYYLLAVQVMELAVVILGVYKELKVMKAKSPLDMVRVLHGLFSVPFIAISVFLYARFSWAFSRQTSRNLIKISWIMLSENLLNFILRAFVQVKAMDFKKETLITCFIPMAFAICWAVICYIATKKQGDYDAPPGLLWQQSKDLIEKNHSNMSQADLEQNISFIKQSEKFMTTGQYDEPPSYYETAASQAIPYRGAEPEFRNLLNFEDDEELPISEGADQCLFDQDLDKMPLYQPRDTVQSLKHLENFRSSPYEVKMRNSCPQGETFQFDSKQFLDQHVGQNPKKPEADRGSAGKVSTFSVSSCNSSTLSLMLLGRMGKNNNLAQFNHKFHRKHHNHQRPTLEQMTQNMHLQTPVAEMPEAESPSLHRRQILTQKLPSSGEKSMEGDCECASEISSGTEKTEIAASLNFVVKKEK